MFEDYERLARLEEIAEGMFYRLWLWSKIKDLLATITGRRRDLLFISRSDGTDVPFETLPTHPIRVEQIKGSIGRADRFDREWMPRQRRDKDRWVGVAVAMMADTTQLPPVNVVQLDDVYYINDGHHRVSAARALGKIYVDANVTCWKISSDSAC
ncbi:MAG: hypothetical protein OHK0046_21960 [Anaerolineae bacterium]